MISKKLMKEFFVGMLQQEHPGRGVHVGELSRKKSEGWFHWKVEVFFEGECLEIDPLIWLKIRGTILQESFAEAIENCPNMEAYSTSCEGLPPWDPSRTIVSAIIEFEETDLVKPWPGLFEGKNPYD